MAKNEREFRGDFDAALAKIHDAVMNGGNIVFDMSTTPNTQRGTLAEDVPYSLSNEMPAQKGGKAKKVKNRKK